MRTLGLTLSIIHLCRVDGFFVSRPAAPVSRPSIVARPPTSLADSGDARKVMWRHGARANSLAIDRVQRDQRWLAGATLLSFSAAVLVGRAGAAGRARPAVRSRQSPAGARVLRAPAGTVMTLTAESAAAQLGNG